MKVDSANLKRQKSSGFEALAIDKSHSMMYGEAIKMPRLLATDADHLKELATIRQSWEGKGLVSLFAVSENPHITIGQKISVKVPSDSGKGDKKYSKFGDYIVIRVVHEMSGTGVYQNVFEAIPANVPMPPPNPHRGRVHATLETALVKKNNDPEKLGRVKVQFVWQKDNQMTPWVRVAVPQAGDETGVHFIPDINDEVFVGFENGNPEKPVVLGGLYHGKATANHWKNDNNLKKGFRTKS
jgi:uncharacterized protein involved in type VI secretion and phage assembly